MSEEDDLGFLTREGRGLYDSLRASGYGHELAVQHSVNKHGTKSFDQMAAERFATEQAQEDAARMAQHLAKLDSLKEILRPSSPLSPAQAVHKLEEAGWMFGTDGIATA